MRPVLTPIARRSAWERLRGFASVMEPPKERRRSTPRRRAPGTRTVDPSTLCSHRPPEKQCGKDRGCHENRESTPGAALVPFVLCRKQQEPTQEDTHYRKQERKRVQNILKNFVPAAAHQEDLGDRSHSEPSRYPGRHADHRNASAAAPVPCDLSVRGHAGPPKSSPFRSIASRASSRLIPSRTSWR